MLLKGDVEEGGEFVAALAILLVVLLMFGWRGARRSTRDVGAVRWIRVSLLGTLNWRAQTVWMRKGEVLVVVQVVEDLVVGCAKGDVVGGFEGSQNDRPKYVIDGERSHDDAHL